MPFTNTQYKEVHLGDGTGSQIFSIPFEFKDETEIEAYEVDASDLGVAPVTKTRNTHFVVNTGSSQIECTGAWIPASGIEVHIERRTKATQEVDLPGAGAFSSSAADEAHDRAELRVAEVEGRAALPVYPMLGSGTAAAFTTTRTAVLSSVAIDAPSGMTGSLVSLTACFYISNSTSIPDNEAIEINVHVGTNGTTSDGIDFSTTKFFAAVNSHIVNSIAFSAAMIRVPDGEKVTVSLVRNSATGTVNVWGNKSSGQALRVGAY